jgi:hypothetical protein
MSENGAFNLKYRMSLSSFVPSYINTNQRIYKRVISAAKQDIMTNSVCDKLN